MKTTNLIVRALVALSITLTALAASSPGDASAQAPPGEAVGTADWRQVAAGRFHTCGIRTNGRLYCWGDNQHGQLGHGGVGGFTGVPAQVVGFRTDWQSVAVGGGHTCAVRTDHRLYCWGDDADGQLGDGPGPSDRSAPRLVAGGGTNWSAVTLGYSHTCGVRSTGTVQCWGDDEYGQVGDGGTQPVDRFVPVRVRGSYRQVDAASGHTCAVTANPTVVCWGDDGAGQLGNGGLLGSTTFPQPVVGVAATWAQVTTGDTHSCGRTTGGDLWCWGDDAAGQLGNATATTGIQQVPVIVSGSRTWVGVSAGAAHTCGRAASGQVDCWGSDVFGQLGDGPPLVGVDHPIGLRTSERFTSVTAGAYHACGRATSGRILCWGDGSRGQVGVDDDAPVHPAPIGILRPQAAAG